MRQRPPRAIEPSWTATSSSMSTGLDPITLEASGTACFRSPTMRSAYSTNIKERHDHSIAIAVLRRGVSCTMAGLLHSISSMTGLILDTVADLEPTYTKAISSSPMIPHVAGGTVPHLPDLDAMPVFIQTLGLVLANIAHHDVVSAAARCLAG